MGVPYYDIDLAVRNTLSYLNRKSLFKNQIYLFQNIFIVSIYYLTLYIHPYILRV